MVHHEDVSSVENGLCGSHGNTHVRNLAALITSSATAAAITASKQWLEGVSSPVTHMESKYVFVLLCLLIWSRPAKVKPKSYQKQIKRTNDHTGAALVYNMTLLPRQLTTRQKML